VEMRLFGAVNREKWNKCNSGTENTKYIYIILTCNGGCAGKFLNLYLIRGTEFESLLSCLS
jgi:hypothetical protein